MNFLGHAAVARRHDDDAAFVLGAVLPDLLPMAGLRLTRDDVPVRVAVGWRSHHHADAAFHESAAFRDGVHALRTDLRATTLTTGPRRAVAHVGWELLLDDTLMADTETIVVFRAALALAPSISTDPRWHVLLDRLATIRPGPPATPETLAERVRRAVSRRPRLAFDEALVPSVADVLARHRVRVQAVAPAVLADVAATIS